MKKQTNRYFLPMTQEAIDAIARHWYLDTARPLFEMLKYRAKNEMTPDDIIKRFPDLIDVERNYRYHLNRMRGEVAQLFEITPPRIQKEINGQLLGYIHMLESQTSKSNLIKELEDSNKFIYLHYPGEDGVLKTLPPINRKKSEQMDSKLFSSPLMDEYIMILRSMLDYFKVAIGPFVYSVEPDMYDYDVPEDLGLYAVHDLRGYMKDWRAFIKICEEYSQPKNYQWTKKGKYRTSKNYTVIEKLDGDENYKWIGIDGGYIPSLTDFIYMLHEKNIFKLGNKTNQGIAFYKFFKIDKKDTGFLLDDLLNIGDRKFADGKGRNQTYASCFPS